MVNLFINGELLDQYKDESVDIVSSVLDVSDITKNTGDFSKSFTIPASKNNNRIFKHWYNASIDNGFDARSKVEGSIDIDGVPFKLGTFRLNKCNIVKGRLESYTINFFGNLPNITDTIGEDLLSDLSFPTLDHDWTSDNVKNGLQNGILNKDIVYTLMANKRYFYNSHSGAPDINATTINISSDANTSNATGVVWSDLRPSVRLSKIIEAIELRYNAATYESPIVFSRDFFSTTEFAEQYLWLKASDREAIGGGEEIVDFTAGSGTYINLGTNIGTFVTIRTGASRQRFNISNIITPASGYENVPYTFIVRNADTGEDVYAWDSEQWANGDGVVSIVTSLSSPSGTSTFNFTWHVKSNAKIEFTATIGVVKIIAAGSVASDVSTGTQTLLNRVVIGDEMPELKIVDFLKGIFNMFKLVAIPKTDGSIYINSLDSYYSQGKRYDATKYIDFAKFDVDRGELLKRISFEFEEPSTIMNMEFKKQAADGQGYGASLVNVYESLTPKKLIDGDTLEVKLPFEQIYFERLIDQNNTVAVTEPNTNIQTGVILDDNLNQVVPKAVLHYVTRQDISATPIRFVNDLAADVVLNAELNSPIHHFGVENPMYSNIFEAEASNFTGESLVNNLYSIHYKDYVTAIFELKRRTFKYVANLPIQIVTRLDLNDVIAINGIDYRINKYSYNLLNGLTKLELINGFDTTLKNRVYIPSTVTVGKYLTNLVFNVEGIEGYTITKIDEGFGTTWVSTSVVGSDNNLAGISIDGMSPSITTRNMTIRYVKDSITTDIIILQNE
tara:strand:+ start:921 stop:3281 length:2361 start_codon:yes stop_codon:yes gene_type:complete